jgi:hypothetical protein
VKEAYVGLHKTITCIKKVQEKEARVRVGLFLK